MPTLILASTSPYRRRLLERLGVAFLVLAPDCDEATYQGQGLNPLALARVLAAAKAASVSTSHAEAIVIGSDQVCALGHEVLGKPGDRQGAIGQLQRLRGRTHQISTAVCVRRGTQAIEFADTSDLAMRALTDAEIERYVDADQPFDCAGSYKIEGKGIALFDRVTSADHTAITGLPLLQLCAALRDLGVELP